MTTPSSALAWRISWTEEPGGLQPMGSQRVRHNSRDLACMQDQVGGVAKYNPRFKSAWAGLKSCVWVRRTWLHQPSSWSQFQGPLCQSTSHQGSEVWDPRPGI